MSSATCTNDITKKLSLTLTEEFGKYPKSNQGGLHFREAC